jgi:hypothetical protein
VYLVKIVQLYIELCDPGITAHPEDDGVGLSEDPWRVCGGGADGPVSSAEGCAEEEVR